MSCLKPHGEMLVELPKAVCATPLYSLLVSRLWHIGQVCELNPLKQICRVTANASPV